MRAGRERERVCNVLVTKLEEIHVRPGGVVVGFRVQGEVGGPRRVVEVVGVGEKAPVVQHCRPNSPEYGR